MDKVSLQLIIDKLTDISNRLYNGKPDRVAVSFELDEIIDDLKDWLEFLPLSPEEPKTFAQCFKGVCENLGNIYSLVHGKTTLEDELDHNVSELYNTLHKMEKENEIQNTIKN